MRRVIEDLICATFSRFVSNHVCNVLRYPCSRIVAVRMSLCVDVIVMLSAYDIMLMLAGVVGESVARADVRVWGQNRALGGGGALLGKFVL